MKAWLMMVLEAVAIAICLWVLLWDVPNDGAADN